MSPTKVLTESSKKTRPDMRGPKKTENGSVREVAITSDGQKHPSQNHYPPRTLSFLMQAVNEKNKKDPSIRNGIEEYDAVFDKWIWIYP